MANPLLWTRRRMGRKAEVTPGTAETITAAEVIRAKDPSIKINANAYERQPVGAGMEAMTPIPGGKTVTASWSEEAKGSGTAGTEPANAPALKAARFNQTDIAAHSNTFTLDNDGSNSALTAKMFMDGKYVTGRGIRGNIKFAAESGKQGEFSFDGGGIWVADGDVSLPTGTGDDSTLPPLLQNAQMFVGEYHTVLEEAVDGTAQKLLMAGGVNGMLEKGFTQGATAQKCFGILVKLKKNGTPASETNGVWFEIQGDSIGDPDGSAITNGTSATLSTTKIATTAAWYLFTFGSKGNRATLTNATAYHVVMKGDYTAADANNIEISADVVTGPNQNSQSYTAAAWGAIALNNLSAKIYVSSYASADQKFAGMEFDAGVEHNLRPDPNSDQGYEFEGITGAKPVITLKPEEMTDANTDWYGMWDTAITLFFHCQLGSAAGNTIEWFGEKMKISNIGDWEDSNGRVRRQIDLQFDSEQTEYGLSIRYT